jgi:TetR/AcrR family transcriptional regulator, cholesterol catabolism regulator
MKDNDKIDEIINAALYLFSSKGYIRTSMAEIAEAVNLTKGGIYHYLDKKEDALVMIHDQMTDAFVAEFRKEAESLKDPEQKLRSWIEAHIMLVKNYQPHIKIFFTELEHLKTSNHYEPIVSKRDEIFNLLYEILKEGKKQKYFRDDIHPKILVFLIMGTLNWLYQWYRPDGPRKIEKIIKDVETFILEGVIRLPKSKEE